MRTDDGLAKEKGYCRHRNGNAKKSKGYRVKRYPLFLCSEIQFTKDLSKSLQSDLLFQGS